MSPQQIARIEARAARIEAIAEMIDFLDLLDGDVEAEDGDGDCCPAGDDEPRADYKGAWGPGDPDDAEPEEDRCTAGDDNLIVTPRRLGDTGDMAGSWHDPDCEATADDEPPDYQPTK